MSTDPKNKQEETRQEKRERDIAKLHSIEEQLHEVRQEIQAAFGKDTSAGGGQAGRTDGSITGNTAV